VRDTGYAGRPFIKPALDSTAHHVVCRPCAERWFMVRDTFSPAFVIVSAKDIAQRAYEIYVDRGYADGFDRQDWLRAEHELKNPPLAERVFPRDATRR
jgi:Protein of unknown function (DUF2934)